MLYQRHERHQWLKVRLARVAIPLLSTIPLITVLQFYLLKHFTNKLNGWNNFSLYYKINVTVWFLISYL